MEYGFSFFLLILYKIFIIIQLLFFKAVSEYNMLLKINESTLFPLIIVIFLCSGTNVLIHILTIITSFLLIDI